MKTALICIGSPLQALCAVEALSYYNINSYSFKVIDDRKRLSQIEVYLKSNNIEYDIVPFHVSCIQSIKRILNLFTFSSGQYDYLFMGDFRLTSNRLEYLPCVKNGGKVIHLDDGNYILELANRQLKASIVTKIRNSLCDIVCKMRGISWRNFYTMYAKEIKISGYSVEENKFNSIQSKSSRLSGDVYFIGTNPLGVDSYCAYLGIDYELYKNILVNILRKLKEETKSGNVFYIPHGRDISDETVQICKQAGVIYKKCNRCIELEISSLDVLPTVITGFGSSALYSLRKMCPNSQIINLHIPGTIEHAEKTYQNIAEMYKKIGIRYQKL